MPLGQLPCCSDRFMAISVESDSPHFLTPPIGIDEGTVA
jgi:hypothetical protein